MRLEPFTVAQWCCNGQLQNASHRPLPTRKPHPVHACESHGVTWIKGASPLTTDGDSCRSSPSQRRASEGCSGSLSKRLHTISSSVSCKALFLTPAPLLLANSATSPCTSHWTAAAPAQSLLGPARTGDMQGQQGPQACLLHQSGGWRPGMPAQSRSCDAAVDEQLDQLPETAPEPGSAGCWMQRPGDTAPE